MEQKKSILDKLGNHSHAQVEFFEDIRTVFLSDGKENVAITVSNTFPISLTLAHSLAILMLDMHKKNIVVLTDNGGALITRITEALCTLGMDKRIVRHAQFELWITAVDADPTDGLSQIAKSGNTVQIRTTLNSEKLRDVKCDTLIITKSSFGNRYHVPDTRIILIGHPFFLPK